MTKLRATKFWGYLLSRVLDPRRWPVSIDANALDRDGQRDSLVNRLLILADTGQVKLIVPKGVSAELSNPATPSHVRIATECKTFTRKVGLNLGEQVRKRQLEQLLRGNAISDKHTADADLLIPQWEKPTR